MPRVNYRLLHETSVGDVIDRLAGDALSGLDNLILGNRKTKVPTYKSVSAAASGMILTFPVACSRSMSPETASMISKAVERQCVTLMQMLFSAYQISSSTDVQGFLDQFHKNIKVGRRCTVDDFINAMDYVASVSESVTVINPKVLQALKEDMKNLNFYLESDLDNKSYNGYKVSKNGALTEGGPTSDAEAKAMIDQMNARTNLTNARAREINDRLDNKSKSDELNTERNKISRQSNSIKLMGQYDTRDHYARADRTSEEKLKLDIANSEVKILKDQRDEEYRRIEDELRHAEKAKDQEMMAARDKASADMAEKNYNLAVKNAKAQKKNAERQYNLAIDRAEKQQDMAEKNYNLAVERDKRDAERSKREIDKNSREGIKFGIDRARGMLLDNDIKKANEMIPSTVVVNFYSKDEATGEAIRVDGVVIGIKAKLIGLDSNDIIDHIITKNNDKHFLLQLLRATTRETSFFKDFLFAIDNAKIDALNNSNAGSSNPMWKVLEQRAIKSKMRRISKGGNDASAITTLVLSQQGEVEPLRKESNIDLMNPRVVGPIMDAYNFMGVIVVDELMEVAHIMWDGGDDTWEDLAFSSLTKEASTQDYKKVINLMTKVR